MAVVYLQVTWSLVTQNSVLKQKKVTGSDETSYGLVCRYQDKQNFYGFSVSTDGYAGIYRVEDGKTSLLSGENYLYTELIEMHDGVNMIVAICQNESLRLEINGVEVLRATDDRFQIGEVGFFSGNSTRRQRICFI